MHKVIVTGVAGCGKSTLGAGIAAALGRPIIEGDDHHLRASKAKMRKGIALQDSDRVRSRSGHFFTDSLVASQFEALESPAGEPGVLSVPASQPLQAQVDAVTHWLLETELP